MNLGNQANPLDSAGYFHNLLLDSIEPYLAIIVNDTIPFSVTDGAMSYTYNTFSSKLIAATTKFGYMNRQRVCAINNESQPASYSSVFNVISSFHSSDSVNLYDLSDKNDPLVYATRKLQMNKSLTNVEITIDTMLASVLISEADSSDIIAQIDLIKQYENEIALSNLSSEAKNRQFLYLSIFKYSYYYWYTTIQDPTSNWNSYSYHVAAQRPTA